MSVDRESPEQDGSEPAVPSLFVPSLLAGIDADRTETRRTAGQALVMLVRAYPETGARVASALVDRVANGNESESVLRTLATFRSEADEAVRKALLDAPDAAKARQLYRDIGRTDPWDLPAQARADGGETKEFLTSFRRVVRPDGEDGRPGPDADVLELDAADVHQHPSPPTGRDRTPDSGSDGHSEEIRSETSTSEDRPAPPTDYGRSESRAVRRKRKRIEATARSETFQRIASRSEFDDLTVVAPETEGRYASVVRTRGTIENTERGLAVRLLDAPEEDSGFTDVVTDRLAAWTRLADTPGVVTVVDWGAKPRPWVATEFVERPLAARSSVPPANALRGARALAASLVQVHQQHIVHGGIDPRSVVYRGAGLDGPARPHLDNVGLIDVYRRTFDPASYLDPRYAAPEYYDSQYGGFDHATDVYQLGMVCYRLLTGRHPYDGSYETVRNAVLEDRPPAPSEVVPELPSAVDDVIAKATARQKLTRYETANGLYQDFGRICDSVLE